MKKNIDQLFKENFGSQEIEPPEMVWTNIERELKKKKERKIIPIWWKYSGVAAVLLIGIFIGKEFNNNENKSIPLSAPEISVEVSNLNIESNKNAEIPEINKGNEVLVTNSNDKNVPSNDSKVEKSTVVCNNSSSQAQSKDNLSENNIAKKSNSKKKKSEITESLLSSRVQSGDKLKNNQKTNEINSNNNISVTKKSNEKIASDDENTKIKPEKAKNEIPVSNNLLAEKQLALIEKIATKKDSIAKKPNVLENLLAEKTKKKNKESKSNKWQITPNIAPIYANSTSNNSTFDSKFNNNSKSNEKNISFGLAVNYAVSKKISIRTGINKFDIGTNTNNIGFYKNSATAVGLNDATALVSNEYAISNNLTKLPDLITLEISTTSGFLSQVTSPNPTTKTEGIINQKAAYFEVPLEISYAIINKKIGLNLITGFSTLFLNKNQVLLVSNLENIDLGQSNNLNKIHYSTNIGLGFNYKFAKSFQINVEPMLKYQINTFKNDFSDTKPYFIGVYSGISYGF